MNILWLSSNIHGYIFKSLDRHDTLHILANRGSYIRYPSFARGKAVSVFHFTDSVSDQSLFNKRKFENLVKSKFASHLDKLLNESNLQFLRATHGYTLERYFGYSTSGLYDALLLNHCANSIDAVVLGGPYQLPEQLTLIFWLTVLSKFSSDKTKYYTFESDGRFNSWSNSDDALKHVLGSFEPSIWRWRGNKPTGEVAITFQGSVKYSNGWIDFQKNLFGKNVNLLRVAELGCSSYHLQPCHEFGFSRGHQKFQLDLLIKRLKELINASANQLAIMDKSRIKSLDLENEGPFNIAIEFLLSVMGPYVVTLLCQGIDFLEAELKDTNVVGGSFGAAPHFETILLSFFLLKKGIVPHLFPHSWTPSHEFHPSTYRKLFAFVSAKEMMPSIDDNLDAHSKELLVCEKEIADANRTVQSIVPRSYKSYLQIFAGKGALTNALFHWRSKLSSKSLVAQFNRGNKIDNEGTSRIKIGIVLNCEMYESSLLLDFNKYFSEMAVFMRELCDRGYSISIRRKPQSTNWAIFVPELFQTPFIRISEDEISLKQWSSGILGCLFFQGTSAIPELMLNGVSAIQFSLQSSENLIEPYIRFPSSIVPLMSSEEILKYEPMNLKRKFLELSQHQKEFVYARMPKSESQVFSENFGNHFHQQYALE